MAYTYNRSATTTEYAVLAVIVTAATAAVVIAFLWIIL
jgi:hypothetical protein